MDRALVAALEGAGHPCTRSQLARAFADGGVRVDGVAIKPGRLVEGPLAVEVDLPAPALLSTAVPEAIPLVILHEDEHVLVLDKPAGLVVHAGPGHPSRTVVGGVLHHLGVSAEDLPVLPGNDAARPGIVHRLDKDTSGVLVVAKTGVAQAHLAAQFQAHSIDRAYLGIVVGIPAWTQRRVESRHGRDPTDRRRFTPDVPHGRHAVTKLEKLRDLHRSALMRFVLETGRTHQIRMHARALGHAIFGDRLYGRAPRDPKLRPLWDALPRHALHAARLGFDHPSAGWMCFEAPLPPDLEALLSDLQGTHD